jgi:integrative and conjugative element protein (TIGR02256 family)
LGALLPVAGAGIIWWKFGLGELLAFLAFVGLALGILVGQLFARLEPPRITVLRATGPRAGDRRTRFSYIPDRRAEQREIDDAFRRGLHYVGDWHTHPDDLPTASVTDNEGLAELVSRSAHSLNAFVLVVVGIGHLPEAMAVTLHDGAAIYRLNPR